MFETFDLAALGWDDAREDELAAHPASDAGAVPGRVVRVERGLVHVETTKGKAAVPATDLAIGDWVITDTANWAQPMSRRTELARKEAGKSSAEQVLAANVDVVVIVEPMDPTPSVGRIERMATLAWSSGATPLLVLTKSDLGSGAEIANVQLAAHGIEVLAVSASSGDGLDELRGRITLGQTVVLLGPSGAGKSTLVNALCGHEVLATGPVRDDGRGKHTTTHRELVVIAGLACFIDTPGIREVSLIADNNGLDLAFDDVVSLSDGCRFADCAHDTEPGCAVLNAVEVGELNAGRLDSYRRLLREVAHQASRKGAHDRSALRAQGRARARSLREINRAKGR